MKKTITMWLGILSFAAIQAQNYHRVYPSGHSGYDVFYYHINAVESFPGVPNGYITSGETRHVSGTAYRFPVVLRSDRNGLLTQPVNFKKTYWVYDAAMNYRPAYSIGSFPYPSGQTVSVGNYFSENMGDIKGVYRQLLGTDGTPINTRFYAFQYLGEASRVIKSEAYPGYLFVCGKSFDVSAWAFRASVMCIDASGNLLWSNMYNIGSNSNSNDDVANTICEIAVGASGGPEIVIAGSAAVADPVSGTVPRLFIQRISPLTGAVISTPVLINPSSSQSYEVSDMIYTNSSVYGGSLLLTGAMNTYYGGGGMATDAWAMMVSANAGTVHWTRQLYPSTGTGFERNVKAVQLTDASGNATYALAGQSITTGGGWNGHIVNLDRFGVPLPGQWINYGGAWDEAVSFATRAAGSNTAVAMAGVSWIGANNGWIAHTNSALTIVCSYTSDNCIWLVPDNSITTATVLTGSDAVQQNAVSMPLEWLVPTTICASSVSRMDGEEEEAPVTETETELSVWPNPATDHITLKIPALKENSTLEITDVSGRVIFSQQLIAAEAVQQTEIDISNLCAKGVYAVTLTGSRKRFTKTLVVQ
ncbi:MAG: T9SS type A sorting domain-containing protein [Bacteroidia bacterium]|jgi:hypothetical protein|nr:T9SS type A sorting domain-containing protein [Bacteroidia bacterium]